VTARVSDVIHDWLGWCPDSSTTPVRKKLSWSDTSLSTRQTDVVLVKNDVVMDYGSTGISIPLFTIILGGTIAGLFAIMRFGLFETWSSLGLILLSIFILGAAVQMVYQDIKKAIIEFTPDTITVRRHLLRPVIIAKDTITTFGVRKNVHYICRWLFRGAMVIFFVGVIPPVLFSGRSQYFSRIISRVSFTAFVVFYLIVAVFFGLLFYHEYIRSRFTHVLAISTNNKKVIGLYVDDPGKMSDMLSKWYARAV